METGSETNFHLTINGLDALRAFVAIVRGHDLDDETLRKLTARLQQSTAVLAQAEQADAGHPHT